MTADEAREIVDKVNYLSPEEVEKRVNKYVEAIDALIYAYAMKRCYHIPHVYINNKNVCDEVIEIYLERGFRVVYGSLIGRFSLEWKGDKSHGKEI